MTFFSELRRRNIFRVALFYAVSGWLILQVADVLFGLLTVPDWTLKFVLGLLLLGFPFALVLAWIYEMTPEGVKKAREVERDTSITDHTGRKLTAATFAVLAAAVAIFAYDRIFARDPAPAAPGHGEMAATAPALSDETVPPSVAVLPFVNMSSDVQQGYFSDGLSDTLIHMLAQIDGIKVAARTSSFAYKGKNANVRDIADELGVNTILEGSVQKAGNQMRIIAQLIDANDGSHLWSKTFDRSDSDIFSVQDEISREVVVALKGSLLSSDAAELAQHYQPTLEAYNEFIRGRDKMALRTSEGLMQAEAHFRAALKADPDYALAMVNLGDVLVLQIEHGDLTIQQIAAEAEALNRRALALQPDLGEAYASLALLASQSGRDDESEPLFVKALELSPNYATTYHWYSIFLRGKGEIAQSEKLMQRAAELDPLSDVIQINLAGQALERNDLDKVREITTKGIARNPDFTDYYGIAAEMEMARGNAVKALQWSQTRLEKSPGKVAARAFHCFLLANFPDPAEANTCTDALVRDYPGHPRAVEAQMFMRMHAGDIAGAITQLEGSLEGAGESAQKQWIQRSLSFLYGMAGQWEKSRAMVAEVSPELFDPAGPKISYVNAHQAIILANAQRHLGNREAAESLLTAAYETIHGEQEQYFLTRFALADAAIHAMRGDAEAALRDIDESVQAGHRWGWWVNFKLAPSLSGLHDQPEFQRLAALVRDDMVAQQQAWREQTEPASML